MVRNLATRFGIVADDEIEHPWKSFRNINWVRITICQLLWGTVVSTCSGPRWVARRHLWGQWGFHCSHVWWRCCQWLHIATLTVNECSQWSERSTRTRVRSSAMSPSVRYCLARSTQTILAMRLSQTRILAKQAGQQHGTMYGNTSEEVCLFWRHERFSFLIFVLLIDFM